MPRKLQTQNQVRGMCEKCHRNPKMPGPNSKLGYRRYVRFCSLCTKKKYGIKNKYHKYRATKKPHCERCGFVAEHKCQLDVHHIDHNHLNNDKANLMTLCSNCHRLEHFG